jgi:hypothetical protein
MVVAFLCIILGVSLILTRFVPEGHQPPSADDPLVLERARLFEQNFASELSRVRADEDPWAVRVREADLDAWLWVRFPAWVAHLRGEEAFGAASMFQMQLDPGRVVLTTDDVSVALHPTMADGVVRIRATSGSTIGRLPVPAFMVDRLVRSVELGVIGSALVTDTRGGALEREDGEWVVPARHRLVDDRQVELLEIRLDEGELVLVLRTLRAGSD